jgi:hypothetical protein
LMEKYNTSDLEWIEDVQPSSLAFRQKLRNILHLTENCSANVQNLNLTTGEYQITLDGKLMQQESIRH